MTDPRAIADQLTVQITYRGRVYSQDLKILRDVVESSRDRRKRLAGILDRAVAPVVDQLLDDHTERWVRVPGSEDAEAGSDGMPDGRTKC